MLNFIGCGSAFNTELGNNGAFIKKDNILFLIDCGSSTFGRIMKHNLLDGVDYICVLMTHTHADHIGSLGDLILYGYYSMGEIGKPNVRVFAPYELEVKNILNLMGVKSSTYMLTQFEERAGFHYNDFHISFTSERVSHVLELDCFGYVIKYEGKTIYYSGDSNMIPEHILDQLNFGEFDLFYQDTCKADYEGNVHLSLRKLDELIDWNLRYKVFCMHLDNGFNKEEAEELGFKVVNSI